MAPLRRYLRITKYSVLECRIYLDNPALAQSWLLNPRDPVLPRVLESIRPLVLPKLVEERERARKKGAKNKGAIKDVLVEEDFEVSLFLTETETRHSLLYKHRQARDKTQTRLVSNSTRLTGASLDAPMDVDGDGDGMPGEMATGSTGSTGSTGGTAPPTLLREDSDDRPAAVLQTIPDVDAAEGTRRSKRPRQAVVQVDDSDDEPAKRSRSEAKDKMADTDTDADTDADADGTDKKQKLAMDVLYDGFAIYGRVLCLVIKRRTADSNGNTAKRKGRTPNRTGGSTAAARPAGLAAMENWIASTQAVPDAMEADVP